MSAPVLEAYTEALHLLGNPASTHAHGQFASEQLEAARERIARRLGAHPALVTLTGGGTESINLAIKGFYWAAVRRANARNSAEAPVLLIAAGEHHATIEWPGALPALGSSIRIVPNHVCNAVNLADEYVLASGGRWPVAARGRNH